MGALIVFRPQMPKRWIEKKAFRKIRWILIIATFTISALLIKVGWNNPGVLAKILVVFGIMGVIKAFLFLTNKTADKLLEFSNKIPIRFYRIGGCFHILIGIVILFQRG